MEEIWKPIPDTDGKYEVSNLGRVRSVERKRKPMKPQSQPYQSDGKPYIVLQGNGKRRTVYLAKLVAEAFVDNPWSYKFVREIDGDVMNCRADNLEWTSRRRNTIIVPYRDSSIRCRCIELDRICDTLSEMAQVLGVSTALVSNAVKHGRKIKRKYTVVPLGKRVKE